MKSLISATVALLIIALLFLVARWPQGMSKTFSQHAAAHRVATYYYLGLFLLVTPLLALFFYGYFIPHYHLSFVFSFAIFLAIGAQLIAAFVPEIGGRKSRIHRLAAGWSAFGLFVAIVCIVFEIILPLPILILSYLTLLFMLFCSSLTLKASLKRQLFQHDRFLLLQTGYYGLFFAVILLVTYLV